MRDLITLLPAMFCEGQHCIGIHGHIACSAKEYELLKSYLQRNPQIIPGRLPDRMLIESLIVIIRPDLSSRYHSRIIVLCKTKSQDINKQVMEKSREISWLFHKSGKAVSFVVYNDILPELIVYDIMRTGIVLGGKHPVTKKHLQSDICTYIGELPGMITDMSRIESDDWNPFQAFLDTETDLFIENSDYPAPLFIHGANPFILPYLHILHRYDEGMIAETIKKIRTCLIYLFSSFPPTNETITDMKGAWKMNDSDHISDRNSLVNALHLRKWLVPLKENELPVFTWPPPENMSLGSVHLCMDNDLWHLREANEFQCRHAWAIIMWGYISGIITKETRITATAPVMLRTDAKKRLYDARLSIEQGARIIVPEDHMQGSIQRINGRFYFCDKPFAILEEGPKHSLELFDGIKKKALLDDIDL